MPPPVHGREISRIPCLDGLRAISIILVITLHALWSLQSVGTAYLLTRALSPYSTLGVRIFFVISGFLITSLLISEWNRTAGISLRRFYFRRVLRIFPPFYLYILVICGLWLTGRIHPSVHQVLSAASFTWNLQPLHSMEQESPDGWYVAHFWSLAYEEQFYLIWPALLCFLRPRRAIFFPLTWLVLAPLVRLGIAYTSHPAGNGFISFGPGYNFFDFIMMGSLVALAEERGLLERLKRVSGIWPLIACLHLAIIAPLFYQLGLHHLSATYYEFVLEPDVDSLGIVLMLFWLVYHAHSAVGRMLEHPLVVHIGVISFSLYIWQQLFLHAGHKTVFDFLPFRIVLIFLAAEISYHFLETPFRKWGRKKRPIPIEPDPARDPLIEGRSIRTGAAER